uniref:Uncharacterized protein n=1 Tax=Eutreptiella gymnastica TaxID=73025 RepID=A0A7S4FYN3_9EUGL
MPMRNNNGGLVTRGHVCQGRRARKAEREQGSARCTAADDELPRVTNPVRQCSASLGLKKRLQRCLDAPPRSLAAQHCTARFQNFGILVQNADSPETWRVPQSRRAPHHVLQ